MTASATESGLNHATTTHRICSTFNLGHLPMPPARKLAIVACMEAQLTIEQALALKTGEAHIMRNAGGIVTEDALRSCMMSHHLLGTEEFIIINHTDCGMLTFEDEDLRAQLAGKDGHRDSRAAPFHAFLMSDCVDYDAVEKFVMHSLPGMSRTQRRCWGGEKYRSRCRASS